MADSPDLIAGLLETAARLVRNGELDRAAWRLADAGGRLRIALEEQELSASGLDHPTGLGCKLPRRDEVKRG
jgi:hypothetical protein